MAPVLLGAAVVGSAVLLTEEIIRRTSSFAQRRVNELIAFSPDVAIASAKSEMRKLVNAVEQGQKYGPTFAAYEDAKSHFDEAIAKFTDTAMRPLVEAVTSLLRLSTPLIERLMALLNHPLVKAWIDNQLAALRGVEVIAETMGLIKQQIEHTKGIVPWFDQQPFLEPSARWSAMFGKDVPEVDPKVKFDETFTRNGLRL